MFLTASVRLPGMQAGELKVELFGLEPLWLPDKYHDLIMRSPFKPFMIVEERPEIYKKRYYRGCLERKPDAKILICRFGGIGDIQWVFPSIREIKLRYPNTKIKLAVFEKDREVYFNCEYIDSFIQTTYPTDKDMAWADYIIDLFDTVEGIGEDEAKTVNPIDITADIVGLKLSNKLGYYKIEPFESHFAKTIVDADKYSIAMPLVASSPLRSWYFHDELVQKINEWDKDIKIYIICDNTPQATPIVNKINDLKLPNVINLTYKTTFRQAVAVCNECDLVFSNDTGIVNILATLNKKVITIYSTVPKETRINHYPSITGLQVKSRCSPCYKLAGNCEYEARCLKTISVDDVFNEIKRIKETNTGGNNEKKNEKAG